MSAFEVSVTTADGDRGIGEAVLEATDADAAKEAFAQENGFSVADLEAAGFTQWKVEEI